MARINEMENEGMIVFGRGLQKELRTSSSVESIANVIQNLGEKYGIKLELIYCGTTINWPEDVEYTPVMIGVVLFEHYDDNGTPKILPQRVWEDVPEIPSAFWTTLEKEYGLKSVGTDTLHLAVAGWTWARLEQNGKRTNTSSEDNGPEFGISTDQT
jgi:hypothetical protein